jgi:predicted PurR-regulated permease PerM
LSETLEPQTNETGGTIPSGREADAHASAGGAAHAAPDLAADAASDAPAGADEPPRVLLHMPVDIRSFSLAVIAAIAVLAVLRWASAFFIPVVLGVVFSYALSPVVDWLARWRIPRTISAAVLILAILGGGAAAVYSMIDDANALINSLPSAARRLGDSMRQRFRHGNEPTLATVQKAAAELQRAAEAAGASPAAQNPRGVAHVVVEKPAFDIREHVWSGTVGLLNFIAQTVLVVFLTYFLLVSGDTFRRKLVRIAGPTFARKKLAVQALDEINAQMQRYLLVQLATSVFVGLASGIGFALAGLNHAAVWGLAAGVLNLVPYVGNAIVGAGAALAGFVQAGELNLALTVLAITFAIDLPKGYLIVPWATSRANRMNPVAVFVGVLAWGWLWGVWGLLLGIPVLMAIKAVCDRVDHLKPVGELLGD